MLANIVVSINDLNNESQEFVVDENEYAASLNENFSNNKWLDVVLKRLHDIIVGYNTEIAYEQKVYRALANYLRHNDYDYLDEETLLFIDNLLDKLEEFCIARTMNSTVLFEKIDQLIEYHLLVKNSLSDIAYVPPINEENIAAYYAMIEALPKIPKEDKLGTLPDLLYTIMEPMESIKGEKSFLLQQLFKYQILLSNLPIEDDNILKSIERYLYHILDIADKDYQIYEAMYEYIINLDNMDIIPFLHSEKFATFIAYTELLDKSYFARYHEYTEYIESINKALANKHFAKELYQMPNGESLISIDEYQNMLTYLKTK